MPKIYIYLGISILFYSNEHEPIHVHGKYQGCESKAEFIIDNGLIREINIKPVAGKKPLSGHVLRDFETFISAYSDKIIQKWIDYFVLHKHVDCEPIDRRL